MERIEAVVETIQKSVYAVHTPRMESAEAKLLGCLEGNPEGEAAFREYDRERTGVETEVARGVALHLASL